MIVRRKIGLQVMAGSGQTLPIASSPEHV